MDSFFNPEASVGLLKWASCPGRKQEDSDLFVSATICFQLLITGKRKLIWQHGGWWILGWMGVHKSILHVLCCSLHQSRLSFSFYQVKTPNISQFLFAYYLSLISVLACVFWTELKLLFLFCTSYRINEIGIEYFTAQK